MVQTDSIASQRVHRAVFRPVRLILLFFIRVPFWPPTFSLSQRTNHNPVLLDPMDMKCVKHFPIQSSKTLFSWLTMIIVILLSYSAEFGSYFILNAILLLIDVRHGWKPLFLATKWRPLGTRCLRTRQTLIPRPYRPWRDRPSPRSRSQGNKRVPDMPLDQMCGMVSVSTWCYFLH